MITAAKRKEIVSLIIFAVALAIMYRWKSQLSTPAVLAFGAAVGAMVLRQRHLLQIKVASRNPAFVFNGLFTRLA